MSIWTHVAGIIRVDGTMGVLTGLDEKKALEKIMGHTASFEGDDAEWDRCDVPIGSEGSIQYCVDITAVDNEYGGSLSRGHISIWGDLRDYDDVDAIKEWFGGIIRKLRPDFSPRDAVLSIDKEFGGKVVCVLEDDCDNASAGIEIHKIPLQS